jgi:hypothetical protein
MAFNPQNAASSKWAVFESEPGGKIETATGMALPLGVSELWQNPMRCQLYRSQIPLRNFI